MLLRWFLGSAAFTIGKYFAPVLPSSVPIPAGPRLAPFGFAVEIDPMLLSIGMLVGPSTAAAIGIGAIAAWGVMAPAVQSLGLVSGPAMAMTGARGFILWPGIVLLTAGAVVQLVIALIELFASKRGAGKEGAPEAAEDHPDQVPGSVLKWGLAAAAAGAVVSMKVQQRASQKWGTYSMSMHLLMPFLCYFLRFLLGDWSIGCRRTLLLL